MKLIFFALSALCFSSLLHAASVTIDSTTSPYLTKETVGILMDQGGTFRNVGVNGKYEVKLKNFHCDSRNRGAFDSSDPLAGIPTSVCRKNSKNVQDTTAGRLYREGRALQQILTTLQTQPGSKVLFSDCAMGYCGTWLKSVVCTVDTNIEDVSAGRLSCVFTDGGA